MAEFVEISSGSELPSFASAKAQVPCAANWIRFLPLARFHHPCVEPPIPVCGISTEYLKASSA